MKNIKIISSSALALAVVLGGISVFNTQQVDAANHTVNPGSSIQTAIDNAASGDTVIVNAGTYTEQLKITKPLTLRGNGVVTVQTKSTVATANKGLDIQNTQDVTVENIIFDGENGDPTKQTGIDVNSVQGVTLRGLTVRNYAKNGIAVTTQYSSSYVAGGNVTLADNTVDNAAWAGIAFYTRSTTGNDVPLSGVQFTGTTTVSNTTYGIQFGDGSETEAITGVNGDAVDLATVVFSGNTNNISNDNGDIVLTINSDSTVEGVAISAGTFSGIDLTIVDALADDTENSGSDGKPIVPKVPDTSTVNA